MKRTWSIRAFFPEIVPAHCADQSCVVEGTDVGDAARRGIARIRRSGALRGKKIAIAKLTVALVSSEKKG